MRDWIRWSDKKHPNRSETEPVHVTVHDEEPYAVNPTNAEELPSELWMLQHLLLDPNFGPGWSIASERAEIALLGRLNKIKGSPLSLYDNVIG